MNTEVSSQSDLIAQIKNVLAGNVIEVGPSTPIAYTVSSVDELPSNAVDGSMALVNLEGKEWYLNKEVSGFADNEDHSMEFICSQDLTVLHKGIKYGTFGPPAYALMYLLDGDGTQTVYGFEGASQFGLAEGWQSEAYRTVCVFSADETAMAWLSTNGKETGNNGYYLQKFYTHENGQWVYKCEVV
jgi:hypothetical protein